MASQEFDPTNEQTHVVDVPHSGDSRLPEEMRETPVNEFDKTSLHEAHAQGFLTTPENPAALVEKQRKKMSRGKKIGMWAAGGLLAGLPVPIYLASALSGGENTEPKQDPGVSGPEVPGNTSGEAPDTQNGIFVDRGEAGFDGEVPAGFEKPILLTDSELSALKSGDHAATSVVYDEKLVPVVNAAVTALLANGGSAEGLNFSNVINDKNTISQLEELVAPYTQYGSENMVDQTVQICDTVPNEDGSRNFCGPLQASRVGLDENIIWDIYAANVDNTAGQEVSLKTAMQPRIYDNKLILATDGAIRSDF